MQACTSLQTDNHASTPPLSFLQAGCPSCCPTNSIKALKAMPTYQANVNFTRSIVVCRSCQGIVNQLGNAYAAQPAKQWYKNNLDVGANQRKCNKKLSITPQQLPSSHQS